MALYQKQIAADSESLSRTSTITSASHSGSSTRDTTVSTSYSSFLTEEVHKATISNWDPLNPQGKHCSYPSATQLATDVQSFGKISRDHSFTKEATFENIAIFLLKSPFLDLAGLSALLQASVLLSILWKSLVKLRALDFSPLQQIDPNYKSYSSIPSTKVEMFLACAIFYNFDLASVIRFTGGNYTASHLDVDSILHTLDHVGLPTDIFNHIKRSLTIGCPAYFNAESSTVNFKAFLDYGNHSSIAQHIATVAKTMTKEFKHSYVIPFPRWIARLCPHLHLTPQGILIKPGKNPRMIWDGSFLPS